MLPLPADAAAMAVYQHALVAVDLGPDSEELVRKALAVAAAFGARLSLAHVVEYVPAEPTGEALLPPPVELEPELARGAENQLAELAAAAGASDAERHVVIGTIAGDLARLAEDKHADLLITGAHERHGLLFFASGTERSLLKHASCDVLVVRLQRAQH